MKNLLRSKAAKLTQEQTDQLVLQLKDGVLELVSPVSMILIGSASRGEMDQQSDIDLVLVFANKAEAKAASKKLYANRILKDCSVDFICVDQDRYDRRNELSGILQVAAEEGKQIYP